MDTLYLVNQKLYTKEKLEELDLFESIESTYVDPTAFELGDDIWLIVDNIDHNFEVITEIEPGVYTSITIESIESIRKTAKKDDN